MRAIRVQIESGDPDFRHTLAQLLSGSEGFSCGDGQRTAGESAVDVVVLDGAPQIDDQTIAKWLDPGRSGARLVVCRWELDAEVAARWLALGVAGLLGRNACDADYLRAIRAVHAGELWFSRALISAALRGQFPPMVSRGLDFSRLTEREREVALHVLQGLSNKEIGERLTISGRTVKAHLCRVFAKLRIRRRGQLQAAMQGALDGGIEKPAAERRMLMVS